jgi:hypothetical protein
MAVRTLSATLNLDTGVFTQKMAMAARDVEAFTKSLKNNFTVVGDVKKALTDAAQGGQQFISVQRTLMSEVDKSAAAQQKFLDSLKRTSDTIGKSQGDLLRYEAAQRGVGKAAEGLIAQIEEKNAALKAGQVEERQAIQLAERMAVAERERGLAAEAFVTKMRQEILVMKQGEDALLRYNAAQLGVNPEVLEREIVARRQLIEETKQAEIMSRNQVALQEDLAKAERDKTLATDAFINKMREEIMLMKEGEDAALRYRAVNAGVAPDVADREIAARRAVIVETQAAAKAAQELANAERLAELENNSLATSFDKVGTHARSSGRAIYEMNVLVHEFGSGRIRQAISSFSILLQQIGIAGGAVLGLTLSLGILYGLSRPLEEAAKNMLKLKNSAAQLGVSVGFLQMLNTASQQLGVSTEKLLNGFGRMDQSFARARAGAKQQVDAYKALGISLKENYTNEQLFQKVLQGWSKLGDGPRKVTVAMELMGRAGKDNIAVLDQLASHMKQINADDLKYGLINPAAVEQGADIAREFDQMKLAAQGFGLALLNVIGPALTKFLTGMTEGTAKMTAFLGQKSTIDGFNQAMHTLGEGMSFVSGAISALVKNLVPLGVALAILNREALASAGLKLLGTSLAAVEGEIAQFKIAVAELGVAEAVVGTTTSGLAASFRGLLSALGGPIGIAIIGVAAAWSFFSRSENAAKTATESFRNTQQNALGALDSAQAFVEKYHLKNVQLTKSLNDVTGAGHEATGAAKGTGSANSEAAKEALARAAAERALTDALLLQASAQARKDASTAQGWANVNRVASNIFGAKILGIGPVKGSAADKSARLFSQRASTFQQGADAGNKAADALDAERKNMDAQAQAISAKVAIAAQGPPATTLGDPTRGGKNGKGKKTPADELQKKIDEANAKSSALEKLGMAGVFDDPVAKARADAQAEIDSGGDASKLKPGEAASFVDAKGHEAGVKAATDKLNAIASAAKKAAESTRASWDEFAAGPDKAEAPIIKLTRAMDEQIADITKLDPKLRTAAQVQANLNIQNQTAAEIAKNAVAAQQKLVDIQNELDTLHSKSPEARQFIKETQPMIDQIGLAKSQATSPGATDQQRADAVKAVDSDTNVLMSKADLFWQKNDLAATKEIENVAKFYMTKKEKAEVDYTDELQRIKEVTDAYLKQTGDITKANKLMNDLMMAANDKRAQAEMTGLQEEMHQWSDYTGNMQANSKKWADDFVKDLEDGKLTFKNFGNEILRDWLDTTLKAKIAPIMNAGMNGLTNLLGGIGHSVLGLPFSKTSLTADPAASAQQQAASTQVQAAQMQLQAASRMSSGAGGGAGGGGGGLGGMLGSLLGLGGGGGGADLTSAANNMMMLPEGFNLASLIPIMHTGGIVGSEGSAERRSLAAFVGNIPRYHTGGYAGLQPGEVPAILQKGEGVFTKGQMNALGAHKQAPNVQVNVINESGMPMGAEEGTSHFDGEKFILDVVTDHINKRGPLRTALQGPYR